jgi:hypothetical protein
MPSFCMNPSWSVTLQFSAHFPLASKRVIVKSDIATDLPVGGCP